MQRKNIYMTKTTPAFKLVCKFLLNLPAAKSFITNLAPLAAILAEQVVAMEQQVGQVMPAALEKLAELHTHTHNIRILH
jgi:hypothetical protein